MPFDAAMLRASLAECREALSGGRVEKISVPEKELVVLSFHTVREGRSCNRKLEISTYPDLSCVHLTEISVENPAVPSAFCLQLRKYLLGARLTAIEQLGFERAVLFSFSAKDEMGYLTDRFLVAETMGKYSNLILLSSERRVVAASRLIELSLNSKRPVLCGMKYENPPAQNKRDPLTETREGFFEIYSPDLPPDKLLMANYYGLSPLVAREIACRAERAGGGGEALCEELLQTAKMIREETFSPVLLLTPDGTPADFSFLPITQYGAERQVVPFSSVGLLLDRYSAEKNRIAAIRRRASDLLRVVSNSQKRLEKKIALLESEILDSKDASRDREDGELITAYLYLLKKGMDRARLTDYSTDPPTEREVLLDPLLTPQQNAAARFKKYNKKKSALAHAQTQLALAREESGYIERVKDSLDRAEGESEINEIREELEAGGYLRKTEKQRRQKPKRPAPDEYRTAGGYLVYCGKNNLQNEYITFKLAQRSDIWFHVKDRPGSHVLLVTEGKEPSAKDYTQAATIAAVCSSASGDASVTVDYTRAGEVKKPSGSKPGYVIYHKNYSTLVRRDEALVRSLRVK